jgi:hypothetical protein
MRIVRLRVPSRVETRYADEKYEPKVRGKIRISEEDDYVFPDWVIENEFKDDVPRGYISELNDILKDRLKRFKKPSIIGEYKYNPPPVLQHNKEGIKERSGRFVYDAEPSTQEKALKKYHHYANKYGIPLSTKEKGKKTLGELAREINAYEHNPKNMARILKQPIDVKFKERGLYLVDV